MATMGSSKMAFLGDRLQVVWLAIIVALLAVGVALSFRPESIGSVRFVAIYGGITAVLAIAGMVRAYRDGELREWLRPAFGDFTSAFFATALLFGASYAFAKYVILPGDVRTGWLSRIYLQMGDPAILRSKVFVVGGVILVISAAEEILWRGFVTTLLAEIAGSRRAWIYAALLYAIAHVPTLWLLADPRAGLNPLVVLAALGCGLVWGALARRNGRLVPGIISHALFDWCVIVMFRFWGPSA
ncbi:MAG: type II CAAX endopeptidase family protein [Polyangiaceae bacterium]